MTTPTCFVEDEVAQRSDVTLMCVVGTQTVDLETSGGTKARR